MHYTQKTCHWSVVNTELRDRYCCDNALSKCTYCKASGHYESACSVKQKDKANTLPAQLAAALNTVQIAQQQPSVASNQGTHTQTQPRNNNGNGNRNNFRSSTNNQRGSSSPIPASQKYCWRFAKAWPCDKSRCQFLHMCEKCGSTDHGKNKCDQTTSSNFYPLGGP